MTWTTNICFALLALAVLLALARLLIGPSLADRVVAADLILTLTAISAEVTARPGSVAASSWLARNKISSRAACPSPLVRSAWARATPAADRRFNPL